MTQRSGTIWLRGNLEGGGNQCSIHRIESEVKIFVEKSNCHCRSQSERRNGQDHNHRKSGCRTCNGGQKKVLLVDTDPQASLTVSLGNPYPDTLSPTLSDMMGKIMVESPIAPGEGILHHPEGVDLMPANIELSGLEVSLVQCNEPGNHSQAIPGYGQTEL